MNRRVVITGVGLVTPAGTGSSKSWEAICSGMSGLAHITRFDAQEYGVQIAGEVKDFNAEDFIDKKTAKHLDLFVQYAVASAGMALKDANFEITPGNAERVGAITGTGLGGLPMIEHWHDTLLKKGAKRITPFFIPMVIPNMGAGHISIVYGAKGPNLTMSTACAAGTHAVGTAFRMISRGDCDAAITGGSESTICPLAIGGFHAMKALSTRNDDPAGASRPFDRDRDGFVIAEGSGMIILEELGHALDRGARIYAEVAGFGLTGDAYHIAAPPEDGEGARRCMLMALKDGGLKPEDIDYINAHGTSTPLNDSGETRAIKAVFKDHAYKLAVSSTKSMIGHALGAAGGIESVLTALSIYHEIMPPTINLISPDPECDLDYVPNVARKKTIRAALNNSFGFGGTNAVLALKRYDGI